jgi:hypothetical protein
MYLIPDDLCDANADPYQFKFWARAACSSVSISYARPPLPARIVALQLPQHRHAFQQHILDPHPHCFRPATPHLQPPWGVADYPVCILYQGARAPGTLLPPYPPPDATITTGRHTTRVPPLLPGATIPPYNLTILYLDRTRYSPITGQRVSRNNCPSCRFPPSRSAVSALQGMRRFSGAPRKPPHPRSHQHLLLCHFVVLLARGLSIHVQLYYY